MRKLVCIIDVGMRLDARDGKGNIISRPAQHQEWEQRILSMRIELSIVWESLIYLSKRCHYEDKPEEIFDRAAQENYFEIQARKRTNFVRLKTKKGNRLYASAGKVYTVKPYCTARIPQHPSPSRDRPPSRSCHTSMHKSKSSVVKC
jgi:hypothetical protein